MSAFSPFKGCIEKIMLLILCDLNAPFRYYMQKNEKDEDFHVISCPIMYLQEM